MADFTLTLTDLETKYMTYVCTNIDYYITNVLKDCAANCLAGIIR